MGLGDLVLVYKLWMSYYTNQMGINRRGDEGEEIEKQKPNE